MSKDISVTSPDIKYLLRRLDQFKGKIRPYMTQMAREAGNFILSQQGLKKYPPATEANRRGRYSLVTHAPMGFYTRGKGWNYPLFEKGKVVKYKNTGSSERYGSQFFVNRVDMGARIGNRASYAKWLTDEKDQSKQMAKYGWRKLIDVAREKMPEIKKIFDKWVRKVLAEVKL